MGQFIIYLVAYPLLWLISILPFRLLYILADILFFLMYYVVGYRKKVVLYNLSIAYPEKSLKERKQICKKSFRHFIDIFMEMIKSFTITKDQMNEHYRYKNPELLQELSKNGKNVVLVGAHYGNWEWIFNLHAFVPYACVAVYTPITNKYFNKRILRSRERFGVTLVPTKQSIALMETRKENKEQSLFGLLSDQSPSLRKTFYWNEFFGVKVPIHTGAEMLAKRFDMNLVMMEPKKIKRGYYETTFSLITDDAVRYPDYQLTDDFIARAEKLINAAPEYYMWTHKRFKHSHLAPEGNIVKPQS